MDRNINSILFSVLFRLRSRAEQGWARTPANLRLVRAFGVLFMYKILTILTRLRFWRGQVCVLKNRAWRRFFYKRFSTFFSLWVGWTKKKLTCSNGCSIRVRQNNNSRKHLVRWTSNQSRKFHPQIVEEKKLKLLAQSGLSQCSFLLTTAFEKLPASAQKKSSFFFGLQKYA